MKLSSFAWLLALIPQASFAVECGNWATSDCVGDTDVRYDADYTNDLQELSPVWNLFEGYFSVTGLNYAPDGLPLQPRHGIPGSGNPYSRFPTFGFFNITIEGSRVYSHRYYVLPPPPADFCAEPIPPGLVNVNEPGVCGVNGFSWYGEAFAVTSYEKDGSLSAIGTTSQFGIGDYTPNEFELDQGYTSYAVDEKTIYTSAAQGGDATIFETTVFIDEDGSRATSVYDYYADVEGVGNVLAISFRQSLTRLADADAFVAAIEEAYTTYNIVPEHRIQGGTLPMQTKCLGNSCPTEEDWCTLDPECSESPYQEPEATVKGGVIAGFTILGFVILLGLLYLYHRRLMAKQAERYRTKFARRIAETIELRASTAQLSPQGLVNEFDAIDNQNKDGFISKEELWEFISSGKAGEMDEKDFEALYAAIDVDKNGKVDFLEFCAFMGQCDVEFQEMKQRQSVVAARSSTRRLTANALSARDVMASVEEGSEEAKVEKTEGEEREEK